MRAVPLTTQNGMVAWTEGLRSGAVGYSPLGERGGEGVKQGEPSELVHVSVNRPSIKDLFKVLAEGDCRTCSGRRDLSLDRNLSLDVGGATPTRLHSATQSSTLNAHRQRTTVSQQQL